MNSEAISRGLSHSAEYELADIYRDIVNDEEAFATTLSKEDVDLTDKAANAILFKEVGRSWGETWFDSSDITGIDEDDESFTIEFAKADYCRSCYMGMIHDRMSIPKSIVDADEDTRPQIIRAYTIARHEEMMTRYREHCRAENTKEISALKSNIATMQARLAKLETTDDCL